jgi:hypothetical protein
MVRLNNKRSSGNDCWHKGLGSLLVAISLGPSLGSASADGGRHRQRRNSARLDVPVSPGWFQCTNLLGSKPIPLQSSRLSASVAVINHDWMSGFLYHSPILLSEPLWTRPPFFCSLFVVVRSLSVAGFTLSFFFWCRCVPKLIKGTYHSDLPQ